MKSGGGVLLGGQAWWWASQHPKDNVLLQFMGNKVSGVAGIHFTEHHIEAECVSVQAHIPHSWRTIKLCKDFMDDLEFLLQGVSEFDISGGTFSEALVHGSLSFPIVANANGQAVIAGGYYGEGRIVGRDTGNDIFRVPLVLLLYICLLRNQATTRPVDPLSQLLEGSMEETEEQSDDTPTRRDHETETFRLHMVTWNVATADPPDDVTSLLHLNSSKSPDLYVIGLQEVYSGPLRFMSDSVFDDPWSQVFMSTLAPRNYVKEQECPLRLQLCVFCDLTLPWTELQEHAVACGSRTEPCPDCGRYVKLCDQQEHEKTCLYLDLELDHNEPSASSGSKGAQGEGKTKTTRKFKQMCKICLESIPIEEIQKHEMRCTAAPLWNLEDSDSDSEDETPQASGLDFSKLRLKNIPQTDEEKTEHSTCPHCQLVLPWATLRWHVEKCKVHICLKHRETTAQS
uniref:TRAFD1/XAF1 zinc finger domain-containing protein n=1 Tax=Knipowitschia caucasica TaxID=637954 RepID=A0AAV2J5S5_KNICA